MKQTVSLTGFFLAFEHAGRKDQFSRPALTALFDYLEEREDDIGEEHELDVIALCCDFTEYDDARKAAAAYGWDEAPERDEGETEGAWSDRCEEAALNWLCGDRGADVIECAGGSVVVLNF